MDEQKVQESHARRHRRKCNPAGGDVSGRTITERSLRHPASNPLFEPCWVPTITTTARHCGPRSKWIHAESSSHTLRMGYSGSNISEEERIRERRLTPIQGRIKISVCSLHHRYYLTDPLVGKISLVILFFAVSTVYEVIIIVCEGPRTEAAQRRLSQG